MKIKIIVLLAVATLASCVSNKKFNELQAEKDALDASLMDVKEKVSMLEEQNVELTAEKDKLSGEISNVQTELTSAKGQLMSVEKSVEEKQGQIDELRSEVRGAFSGVESAVTESNARIKELEDMLYVELDDSINFSTASARVDPDDKEVLDKIASMLKSNPNLHFIVEGHADKRSINTDKYKDNWDLSAARSIAVVRKLIDLGVEPTQLTAAGRAEHAPIADGDDRESLSKNRRTELIVVPNIGKLYQYHKQSGS